MKSLLEMVNIDIPIIQAGMAGGITTSALVAAVANQGALGTIGAGYMSAASLKEEIGQVKKITNKPFAVNLFATNLESTATDIEEMQDFLNQYRYELGIESGAGQVKVKDYLKEKIGVILEENVPIVSTAFGVLSPEFIKRLKANQVTLIGMATTLGEAEALVEAGYDMIVAQGHEAGGHRGTFDMNKHPDGADIGMLVLVQLFVEHLRVPIIAAGGIHSQAQMDTLTSAGAQGVQLGTRFLLAKEAGTNRAYRRALLQANTDDTVITKVFSGRPARAVVNRFIMEVEESKLPTLPFPIQNALTKDIRAAATASARPDFLSLWAGQGVGALTQEETVQEIIDSFVRD